MHLTRQTVKEEMPRSSPYEHAWDLWHRQDERTTGNDFASSVRPVHGLVPLAVKKLGIHVMMTGYFILGSPRNKMNGGRLVGATDEVLSSRGGSRQGFVT